MPVKFSLDFPFAYGAPTASAAFRSCPEDFMVTECYGRSFSGEGEHLCFWIEKTSHNTRWVASLLAEALGVDEVAVGYCGLKDRHAVTRQWFSVHLPAVQPPEDLQLGPGIRVITRCRHRRKLRRGDHDGNYFQIRLRAVTDPQQSLRQRLEVIRTVGVPNYFGPQRFGRDGQNLRQADCLFQKRAKNGRHSKKGSRDGLYLSAARAYLFNLVLAARVREGTWNQPVGAERQPQGPLWGRGRSKATEPLRAFEENILAPYGEWCRGLEFSGLEQQRRDLVLIPEAFGWRYEDDDLLLTFVLPSGVFATSVLRELAQLREPSVDLPPPAGGPVL